MQDRTATITYVDPSEFKISKEIAAVLRTEFSYMKEFWIKGPYRKTRKEYAASTLLDNKDGTFGFYAGLLDRASYLLKAAGYVVKVENVPFNVPYSEPFLPGIVFKPEQLRAVHEALKHQRGILKHPTGTGKTILGCGILSGFWGIPFLWLCHTKDLMYGAAKELKSFGFDVGLIGDGHFDFAHNVVVSTRQSFVDRVAELRGRFNGIIVDEAHHVAAFEGDYFRILTRMQCPIVLGLTATIPTKEVALLAMEGLIGPILDEVTINESADLGRIAKPRIQIVRLPKQRCISDCRTYAEVVDQGIVNNLLRNRAIVEKAELHIKQGHSVLTMINQIEHGHNLEELFLQANIPTEFVWSDTEGEMRVAIKEALNSKQIHNVICSSVWREGINIPGLNVLILGHMGKADLPVLQAIGRGLRVTDDKQEVWIYDIFDPSHKYLIAHFGERIGLYCDNGWL
jgi:superfamily II DNA or RNA helicase